MYAIEFETDIKDRFIEIQEYEKLVNRHVRVIILADEIKDKMKSKSRNSGLDAIFSEAIDIKIDQNIDIDKLCDEVNDSDIF